MNGSRATEQEGLIRDARTLGVALTARQAEQLLRLLGELAKWNRTHNLTAITDRAEMITHHLLDSLSVHTALAGQRVADVGTGAGFPGLPLAVVYPNRVFTLIDSNNKKVRFVAHAVRTLGLANVTAVHARAEAGLRALQSSWQPVVSQGADSQAADPQRADTQRADSVLADSQRAPSQRAPSQRADRPRADPRRGESPRAPAPSPFDTVVARAFAALPELLEKVAPLCGPQTRVLAMKGKRPDAEIAAVPRTWRVIETRALAVPGLNAERHLVILQPADPA
ncbi:MAG TPA: 16S rRNA (guanine(527)-N(7))-methyltransferase RsmG [Steroidobacteraceae bacterium]|nr:16S rRNA (guanine(527)-N(7))-methyltransferase RsmG [Steroidobacteraceae bacterium]